MDRVTFLPFIDYRCTRCPVGLGMWRGEKSVVKMLAPRSCGNVKAYSQSWPCVRKLSQDTRLASKIGSYAKTVLIPRQKCALLSFFKVNLDALDSIPAPHHLQKLHHMKPKRASRFWLT